MNTRNLVALLILLVAILGYLFMFLPERESASMSSGVIEPQVALTVAQFGKSMQFVSLLAPARDIRSAMDTYYAPYVTPELLSVWKIRLQDAPGRITSSPWPDRIQVHSIEPQTDDSYVVRGVVVEVTSYEKEHGGIAGTYPVLMRLARYQQKWRIMQFEKGDYSAIPHETTIRGTYECLPHRDTSGPQTMECALGLKQDDTNAYFALDMRLVQGGDVAAFPTGTHMSVSGILTPVEMLSSIQKYNIVGIIQVTNILEPVQ